MAFTKVKKSIEQEIKKKIKEEVLNYDISKDKQELVISDLLDLAMDYKWDKEDLEQDIYDYMKQYFNGSDKIKYKKK